MSPRAQRIAGAGSLVTLFCAEPSPAKHCSSVGRPRRLTDSQVAWVLTEYSRYLTWRAQRTTVKSQRQLAKELGVSQGTINLAIRSRGHYKQLSPELRSKRSSAEHPTTERPDAEDES